MTGRQPSGPSASESMGGFGGFGGFRSRRRAILRAANCRVHKPERERVAISPAISAWQHRMGLDIGTRFPNLSRVRPEQCVAFLDEIRRDLVVVCEAHDELGNADGIQRVLLVVPPGVDCLAVRVCQHVLHDGVVDDIRHPRFDEEPARNFVRMAVPELTLCSGLRVRA